MMTFLLIVKLTTGWVAVPSLSEAECNRLGADLIKGLKANYVCKSYQQVVSAQPPAGNYLLAQ